MNETWTGRTRGLKGNKQFPLAKKIVVEQGGYSPDLRILAHDSGYIR